MARSRNKERSEQGAPVRNSSKKKKQQLLCPETGQVLTQGSKDYPQRIPKSVANDFWFGGYWETTSGSTQKKDKVFLEHIKFTIVPMFSGVIKPNGEPDNWKAKIKLSSYADCCDLLAAMMVGLKFADGVDCVPYIENKDGDIVYNAAEIERFAKEAEDTDSYLLFSSLWSLASICSDETTEWSEYLDARDNGAFDDTPCRHYADYPEWYTEKASKRELRLAVLKEETRDDILAAREARDPMPVVVTEAQLAASS